MATYDNLNIATTTLTFSGNGNTSVASGTFDLSTLNFLPNVPLIDQIEVERVFDTGYDTKFGAYAFTIADRRQMFIFPKDWYTINEQTKVLTFKDLSTIPLKTSNNLDYPYSRTYTLISGREIDIPVVQASYSSVNGIVRQADIVYIRRKTPSINSIVTFAPGTRLTTTQLNLQFDQLKYIVQELTAKFRNESILKYDENAVDGPFLGQGDLKMNNNYIKDVNSPAFTQLGTFISDSLTNGSFNASTFLINLGTLGTAIRSGTIHRTGVDNNPPTYTGNYNADNLRLINLADGIESTDAATFGQIQNANNITTGTLSAAIIGDGTLSLRKLSQAAGQNYVLPSDALPVANSLNSATPTSFGASSGSNNNNMLFASVDSKGRITAIGHRNLSVADLPDSTANLAGVYGDSTTVLTQVTVDSKGRITGAQERAITATDISSVNASAVSGALAASNLPLVSGYSGTTTTTSIPNSITVDTHGRVTSVSGGSITASNVSDFNSAVRTNNRLDQLAAPTADVSLNNRKILLLADPTISTDAATKNYVDTNFTSNTNLNGAIRANRLDQMATPTGPVGFGNQKITGLGTPTDAADAATKGYVDTDFTKTVNLNTPIDARLQTNSVYLSATGILNAGGKPITNVTDPTNNQDVVTKKYFTDNSIVSTGTAYSVGSKPIINLTMRAGASLEDNDAVNYGLVRAMSLFNQAVTDPQTFTTTWPTGTTVSPNKAYVFSLSTLAATTGEMLIVTDSQNRTYVPTITVPTTAGQFFILNTAASPKTVTVYLDSGITPTGTLTVRNFGTSRSVSAAIAGASTLGLVQVPTAGGLLIENGVGNLTLNTATASQLGGIKIGTGLSIASGTVSVTSVAGNSTLGQVMVAAVGTSGLSLNTSTGALSLPTATTTQLGGIRLGNTLSISNGVVDVVFPIAGNTARGQVSVDAVGTSGLNLNLTTGALSLPTATPTQLGGVKVNTSTGGLTNTSGLIAVDLTDSTTSQSATTVANSKAVNDLRGLTVLRDGTQAMSGKLTAVASTTSIASLNLPSGVAPNSPVIGDVWNQSGTLKLRTDGSTTKDIAFTDSSISGNAATATTLATGRTITLTGAVTGTSTAFNGSANLSFATTLATGQAVTSLASSDMTVSSSTGAVTLTLPQSIATNSSVTFNKATLGNIRISNTANQIDTSSGNLTLDSTGGTTTINDNTSISGSLTVTGTNTTSLGGAVTLGDSLALSTAAAKIALGNTAAAATTSIERIGTAGSVVGVGDIVMRTPTNRKAYLVSNDTNTTAAIAGDAIITETALASRISGLSSTYMSNAGAVNSAGSQTFGSSASSGAVFIQTGTSPTTKVTIAANGSVTLTNALTVDSGGATITAGGLTVGTSGTTSTATVYGPLVVNGTISGVATPTASGHAATKGYVDTYNDSVSIASVYTPVRKAYLTQPITSYKVAALNTASAVTISTSGFAIGVPEYFPIRQTGGTRSVTLSIAANHKIVLLYKYSSSDPVTGLVLTTATVSVLLPDTITGLSEILAKRLDGDSVTSGTFTKLSLGTIWDGGATGTTVTLGNGSISATHNHDFVLMRIA